MGLRAQGREREGCNQGIYSLLHVLYSTQKMLGYVLFMHFFSKY